MKSPSLPFLAFGSCALIWGSTFLAIRIGDDSLPPLWACTLRLLLAGLLLNLVLVLRGTPWPRGQALRTAASYGFWEFGLCMPLLYWGEKVVPSGLSAVIFGVCPVTTMIGARLLGMEELNPKRLGAAVLSFVGVGVIFWKELGQGASVLGPFSVLVAAIGASIAILMLQRGPKVDPIAANAVGSLTGAVFPAGASLLTGERLVLPTTPAQIVPVVYLAIAGSMGAFVIFAWLANRWKATSIAFLGVVVPVIAVVLGSLVRHEVLSVGVLVGAAIVLVGVTIALRAEAGGERALSQT